MRMKLTEDCSRIAVPHGVICPECKRSPGDWHAEWLPEGVDLLVGKGQAAMDCPYRDCGAWVTSEGRLNQLVSGEDIPPERRYKRSLSRARKYASGDPSTGHASQTGGLSLEEWIETVVPAYKGYDFGP